MLSDAIGVEGKDIMFSSNDTPAEEFVYAAKLGATINLDDITHIDFLEKTIGKLPETISCRYNPGGLFQITTDIMDNPGDAKYGFTIPPDKFINRIFAPVSFLSFTATSNNVFARVG